MRPLAWLIKLLPQNTQAFIKESIAPVGSLDYARKPIRLHIDSPTDIFRLGACAKEPETVSWLEAALRPGDVLFDVGANVGAYSLVAAAICEQVRVYAFEPGVTTFAQLSRNVLLNGVSDRVFPLPIGLAESSGLNVMIYSDLKPGAAGHQWGESAQGGPSLKTIVCRIDDLPIRFETPSPTLMKIDVDGYELGVLQGATHTLRSGAVRSLLVETGLNQSQQLRIVDFLTMHGFVVSQANPHRREVANLIFDLAPSKTF